MMKAQTEPRKIYTRNGVTHILYGGVTFGPGKGETFINPEKEVKIEVLDPVAGRKRIQVKQMVNKKTRTEVWQQVKVPVTHRAS